MRWRCQPAHLAVGAARYSTSHWPVSRLIDTRASCAASSGTLWQFWQRSSARLTNSSPHALHADGGKTTTVRPSVFVISPCNKARSVDPTRTYTAMTAASQKRQCLRLLRVYHWLSQRPISSMRKADGRSGPRHKSVTTSPQTSSTREEELDLGVDPPQSDGIHPEEGLNSRHRRKLFAHILHPPSPRNAPTPTPLCLFLFTGPTPLALARTHAHERRQLLQLVGRMEWHIPRLARLIVFGPHANRAGHRRAGYKRRPQATRSTKADDGHDEEEITQNRD